jgi:imidazolonepropionase-like amidohydrolase
LQFSEAEIRAIVEEASFRGAYVMAHANTAAAIKLCLEFGVSSGEHGNLIDAKTASLAKEKDAFVAATLSSRWY